MLLENIGENFEGPSWSNRIFFYFCLFSSLLIIFLLVFISFTAINPDFAIPNGPHYNSTELRNMGFFDNERYLISALVQSLAATIALVITLSLVAVQLAAQSYSARVIDVYKNNPDMWILLSIYIAVIFYGLGLLKVIDVGVAGINMEFAIFAAYFLGFFAFVCLIPYMLKTLDLLKPSTVIKLLAADIIKEKILEALEKDGEIAEKDPVQPIIDMINAALERNDYETARNGLKAIENRYKIISLKEGFTKDEERKVSNTVLKHIEKIGDLSIDKNNKDTLLRTIYVLKDCGIVITRNNLNEAAIIATQSLEYLGFKTAKKELDYYTQEIIGSIKDIEDIFIEKSFNIEAIKVSFSLQRVVREAVVNKCGCAGYSILLLEQIGSKAIEVKLKQNYLIVNPILKFFDEIIDYAEKNGQEDIKKMALESYFSLIECSGKTSHYP